MEIASVFVTFLLYISRVKQNFCSLCQFIMVNINSTWSFRQMCYHKYPDYKYQNYTYKYRKDLFLF